MIKRKNPNTYDRSSEEVLEFLRESNAIEGVYDEMSLKMAARAWQQLIVVIKLTVFDIMKAHKILMLRQDSLDKKYKGEIRDIPVYVGGKEALPSSLISQALESWVLDAMASIDTPGEDGASIKADHVKFEKIHPFVDGNGRIGRMLMNWQRVSAGLPLLVIHEGEEQLDYYKWFREDV